MFGDFVDCTYSIELEIKDTTDTNRSASYIYLHFDYFNFPIVDKSFMRKRPGSVYDK
jgi:hypothetical protein